MDRFLIFADFFISYQEWQAAGVEHLWLPTPDLTAAPSQHQLNLGVIFCERFRESGGSVYVHCKAGRTRSATVVACYLIQVDRLQYFFAVIKHNIHKNLRFILIQFLVVYSPYDLPIFI